MATSIPISGLNDITTVRNTDFFPLVRSGSAATLTTFRASVSELNNWFAASGSVLSASWASASISSSWASFASQAFSASYAKNSSTSSISISASYAKNSGTASLALNAITASYAQTVVTASYALSSSQAASASFATTASYSNNSSTSSFAITGNFISASYAGSSSQASTASYARNAATASFVQSSGGTSGIVFLDTPVFIASAPVYSRSNPYLGWQQIIGAPPYTAINVPTYVANTTTVGDSYYNATSNLSAGPITFHAWNGTGVAPNTTNIPSTARLVIVDVAIRTTWPDHNVNNPTTIMGRKNSGASWICLIGATNADPGNAGQTSLGQAMIPLHTDGTLQVYKPSSGPDGACYGWFVRIIGYIT